MATTLVFTAIISAVTGAAAYFIYKSLRHFGELEDSHLIDAINEIDKAIMNGNRPVKTVHSLLPPKAPKVPRFPIAPKPETNGMPEHVAWMIEDNHRRELYR